MVRSSVSSSLRGLALALALVAGFVAAFVISDRDSSRSSPSEGLDFDALIDDDDPIGRALEEARRPISPTRRPSSPTDLQIWFTSWNGTARAVGVPSGCLTPVVEVLDGEQEPVTVVEVDGVLWAANRSGRIAAYETRDGSPRADWTFTPSALEPIDNMIGIDGGVALLTDAGVQRFDIDGPGESIPLGLADPLSIQLVDGRVIVLGPGRVLELDLESFAVVRSWQTQARYGRWDLVDEDRLVVVEGTRLRLLDGDGVVDEFTVEEHASPVVVGDRVVVGGNAGLFSLAIDDFEDVVTLAETRDYERPLYHWAVGDVLVATDENDGEILVLDERSGEIRDRYPLRIRSEDPGFFVIPVSESTAIVRNFEVDDMYVLDLGVKSIELLGTTDLIQAGSVGASNAPCS